MNARQRRRLRRAHQRETIAWHMSWKGLTHASAGAMDPWDLPWWWEGGVLYYTREGTPKRDAYGGEKVIAADDYGARQRLLLRKRHERIVRKSWLHRRRTRQCPHCKEHAVAMWKCGPCRGRGRVSKMYLSKAEIHTKGWRRGHEARCLASVKLIGAHGAHR